jgi:hypothetical protein
MRLALSELVTAGQLAAKEDGRPVAWIDPPAMDREPNPPYGYVVSFVRFHERGFTGPESRFLRGLCFHYGVELHNFASNAISQAATFVGVCEGFLGIPVNWDLWIHLFRAELHTVTTPEPKKRHAVRAGDVTISLWETRRELYIPCTMTSNNADWERGWFYLRNDEPGLPPWTGKVVREKDDSWWHGLSPPSRQDRLDSALKALKALADGRLTATLVLANLHPVDRPSHGEAAPHLRDGGDCRPCGAGAIATAARSLPAGVRGHKGEARCQPQGHEDRRHHALGVHHAPRGPTGE